jgi:hypothetical protein
MYKFYSVAHLRSVTLDKQHISETAADAALGHAPLTQNRCACCTTKRHKKIKA